MSLNAATLRLLAEKGLSASDIVEVAEAMEVRRDPTAADRMRRYRAKKAVTRNVTAERDGELPPNEYISNPPVPPVEAEASTAPKGRSERGSKIPDGWEAPTIAELSPEARALAERWPPQAYRAEAEAFRNYWLAESGAKARKSNWNRAWANRIVAVSGRVMREAKFAGTTPTTPQGGPRYEPQTEDELRRAIEAGRKFGWDVSEHQRKLDALSARPPPPIAKLISGATERMRA